MKLYDRDFNSITEVENLLWEELKEQEKVGVTANQATLLKNHFTQNILLRLDTLLVCFQIIL